MCPIPKCGDKTAVSNYHPISLLSNRNKVLVRIVVRVIFCDISKAFDRVWHAGLIHKIRAAGISGKLLDWFTNYLFKRRQRDVLPGVESFWTFIKAGVHQGSIFGHYCSFSLLMIS